MSFDVRYSPDAALQAYVAQSAGTGDYFKNIQDQANQRRGQLEQQQNALAGQGNALQQQAMERQKLGMQQQQMGLDAYQKQQQFGMQSAQMRNDAQARQQQMGMQERQGQMDAQRQASQQAQHAYEFDQAPQRQMDVMDHQAEIHQQLADAQQEAMKTQLSYQEEAELQQAKNGRAAIMSDPNLSDDDKARSVAIYNPKITQFENRKNYASLQQQQAQTQKIQADADLKNQMQEKQVQADAAAAAFQAKTIPERIHTMPVDENDPDGPKIRILETGPGRDPIVLDKGTAPKEPKPVKPEPWDEAKERRQAEAEAQRVFPKPDHNSTDAEKKAYQKVINEALVSRQMAHAHRELAKSQQATAGQKQSEPTDQEFYPPTPKSDDKENPPPSLAPNNPATDEHEPYDDPVKPPEAEMPKHLKGAEATQWIGKQQQQKIDYDRDVVMAQAGRQMPPDMKKPFNELRRLYNEYHGNTATMKPHVLANYQRLNAMIQPYRLRK